jgi:hemerythrin HHE cation binding domain-containing protein
MLENAGRDDLFTQIHKALRHGLLSFALRLGQSDADDYEAVLAEWEQLHGLLMSHTGHEERHIFALVDTKRPEATGALHHDHDHLDDLLSSLDGAVRAAAADKTGFFDAYVCANAFLCAYLPHLRDEEQQVMPAIWELCDDAEIAACRAAFMAEIGPGEMAYTLRLMLAGLDTSERTALLRRVRAELPAPVFADIVAGAEHAMSPTSYVRLTTALTFGDAEQPVLAT